MYIRAEINEIDTKKTTENNSNSLKKLTKWINPQPDSLRKKSRGLK